MFFHQVNMLISEYWVSQWIIIIIIIIIIRFETQRY